MIEFLKTSFNSMAWITIEINAWFQIICRELRTIEATEIAFTNVIRYNFSFCLCAYLLTLITNKSKRKILSILPVKWALQASFMKLEDSASRSKRSKKTLPGLYTLTNTKLTGWQIRDDSSWIGFFYPTTVRVKNEIFFNPLTLLKSYAFSTNKSSNGHFYLVT